MSISEIKQRAKNALQGKWGIAVIAALVASIFGADQSGSVNFNFDFEDMDFSAFEDTELEMLSQEIIAFIEQYWPILLASIAGFAALGFVLSIVTFCLGSIVGVGYQKFNLDLIDGNNATMGTLFSYFKHWKNAIVTNLLTTLYVFLWSLLCLIPGIIAGYKYALVPFILAEDPEIEPNEALNKSKHLMEGHKMELFLLYLSFIGWHMLSILTCGIGYIWLTPYINASVAEFYRSIAGKKPEYDYVIEND